MRALPVILALLLLPVLALIHRSHFFRTMQGQLLVRVMGALEEPELASVKSDPGTMMNHLDVILSGTVPDVIWRERAREKVNAIRGIRCRDEDNHIHVPAGVEGTLEGETLHLKGWLHDDATLREVTLWLTEARPGLVMETSGVKVSPYVAFEESPRKHKSATFQPLWTLIEMPAKIDITKHGDSLRIHGLLPTAELKQSVIAAIIGRRAETTLDEHSVRTGPFVRTVPFTTKPHELCAFLKVLFESQQDTDFRADSESLSFTAEVTDAQQQEWKPLLEALGSEKTLKPQWKFKPSPYHLTTYKLESKLPPEALTRLKETLAASTTRFPAASYALSDEQVTAFAGCAQAILAAFSAAPDLKIVVGAHPDVGGDSKGAQLLARRRAEAIVEQFVDREIPARIFEIVPFSPPHSGDPEGEARSHTVEMLLK